MWEIRREGEERSSIKGLGEASLGLRQVVCFLVLILDARPLGRKQALEQLGGRPWRAGAAALGHMRTCQELTKQVSVLSSVLPSHVPLQSRNERPDLW